MTTIRKYLRPLAAVIVAAAALVAGFTADAQERRPVRRTHAATGIAVDTAGVAAADSLFQLRSTRWPRR